MLLQVLVSQFTGIGYKCGSPQNVDLMQKQSPDGKAIRKVILVSDIFGMPAKGIQP
jgi:hypothetical protein